MPKRLILWGICLLLLATACGSEEPAEPPAETNAQPVPTESALAQIPPTETAVLPTQTPLPPPPTTDNDSYTLLEETDPTAAPPTPEPTATEPVVMYGITEEGAYFMGHPNAAVTMIDYSDFL